MNAGYLRNTIADEMLCGWIIGMGGRDYYSMELTMMATRPEHPF